MTEEKVNLSAGGVAVVLMGTGGFVKEYANDPQVKFIDCKQTHQTILPSIVPENTKVILFTEGVPQWHRTWAFSYAQRKKIPYLTRKSNQAVYDTIKGFFDEGKPKVTIEEVKENQEKGRMKRLIEFIDWKKSNAENAKVLLRKAAEMNIKTTEASCAQLVSKERRSRGQTAVPKSIRSKLDVSVELLDSTIKDLTSMRDYLIEVTEENRILKQKVEKFKKALDD